MKKWLVMLLAALALGLIVVGCGDDDDDDGGGNGAADTAQTETAPTETEQTDTGGGGGAPEETEVEIGDNFFEPPDVTVPAGSTVTWTNAGQSPHTVTHDDFDSGTLEPGSDFSQEFADAGDFDYVCTIHPGQEGTVTVE